MPDGGDRSLEFCLMTEQTTEWQPVDQTIEQVQWQLDLACERYRKLGNEMAEIQITIQKGQRRLFQLGTLQSSEVS